MIASLLDSLRVKNKGRSEHSVNIFTNAKAIPYGRFYQQCDLS
uniref:Uncharacterized protein n=1 Tax=Methylophaga nitratireducenticrescens TaxID=754476 RepID=I1XN06_METNJ